MNAEAIHYYWRPGCIFCARLRRGLDRAGIDTVDHDIWDDPDAAMTVRLHANGNETVPTVVVGDVGLVNPSLQQVVEHVRATAPHLLPDDFELPEPTIVSRLFG